MRLTPKQAAERIGISLSLVYQLLQQRKIPAYRVGLRGRGKWLIEEEDLERFLDSCRIDDPDLTDEKLKHIR